MASTKSLEDMLSSEVDESAISALVGSLESQLASPTIHAASQEASSTSVTNNHVNNNSTLASSVANTTTTAATNPPRGGQQQQHLHHQTNAAAGAQQKLVNSTGTNNSVIINADSSKSSGAPASSVAPSAPVQANTYSVTLPGAVALPASGYINQFQTIRVPAPTTPGILQRGGPVGTIPNGNAGVGGGGAIAAALTTSKAGTPLGVITTMAGATGKIPGGAVTAVATSATGAHVSVTGIGAMQNLANVAARQQPLIIPTSQQQVRKPLPSDRGRVGRRPDYMGTDPTAQLMSRFPMTRPSDHYYPQQGHPTQTVIAVASKPGTQPTQSAVTSAGGTTNPGVTNMVMSNQQILQGVQIVNVNPVRAAGPGSSGPLVPIGQKSLAPRVVLSNHPVRIAAGPQVVGARPGTPGAHGVQNTITLQPGMVRGTLLVKTENGQYQLVNVGATLGAGAGGAVQGQASYRFYPPGTQPGSVRAITSQPMTVTLPVSHANQHLKMQQQSPHVMHTVLQSQASTGGLVGSMSHTTTTHSALPSPSVLHHGTVRGNPVVAVQSAAQHLQQQRALASPGGATTPHMSAAMVSNVGPTPVATSVTSAPSAQSSTAPQMSPDTAKKKCKNFLSTLLRLASDQPEQVATNVKNLIQGLIDGVVLPEDFTNQLQRELNSSPQPCLIPFLKKSLPFLRYSLTTKELSIEGVRPPPAAELPGMTASVQPQHQSHVTTTVAPQVQLTQRANLGQQHGQVPLQPPSVRFMSHHAPGAINTQASITEMAAVAQAHRMVGINRPTRQPGPRFAPPLISTVSTPTSVGQGAIRSTTPSNLAFTQAMVTGLQRPPTISRAAGAKAAATATALANATAAAAAASSAASAVSSSSASSLVSAATITTAPSVVVSGAATTISTAASISLSAASVAAAKEKRSFSSTLKDEDDINDVAAMGGVNLAEESARIMAQNADFIGSKIRSCKDENFLFTNPLQRRIREIALRFGLEEPPPEVAAIVSHATQERLKDLVEKVGIIAEHRLEVVKGDLRHEVGQDVKGQLKFLEELDRLEKRRHEEQEREMLLRAAKSRSKLEDPEQLKLKQKAKEMQRAELEARRNDEANNTALLAIGPRKRLKTESQASSSSGDGQQSGSSLGSGNNASASSSLKAQVLRPRVKRVNLRDLVFLMEQEPETCRSVSLYKAFLK